MKTLEELPIDEGRCPCGALIALSQKEKEHPVLKQRVKELESQLAALRKEAAVVVRSIARQLIRPSHDGHYCVTEEFLRNAVTFVKKVRG